MQHSHTLLTSIALIDAVAAVLGDLWAADPALARQVREAGTGVAQSLAAARFARTRALAVRHRRRARGHAVALIAHLRAAPGPGYHVPAVDHRAEAIAHAARLVGFLERPF